MKVDFLDYMADSYSFDKNYGNFGLAMSKEKHIFLESVGFLGIVQGDFDKLSELTYWSIRSGF